MMKISVRERRREERFIEDPMDLESEREERLRNDELDDWEAGFEEGYFSDEDLL